MERKSIIISHELADQRIDRFLRNHFPDCSLSEIYSLLRKKFVRVNGAKASEKYILEEGDEILYPVFLDSKEKREPTGVMNLKPSFTVLFEDKDIIAVNKPAGLAVHEGTNTGKRTLVAEVQSYLKDQEGVDAHLVHRLDKDTSGVMIIAKNRRTAKELGLIFKDRVCEKKYIALLMGHLPEQKGIIDMPLEKHETMNFAKKVTAGHGEEAKRAITRYEVKENFGPYSLVDFYLETGRMHQIRVHSSELGSPLAMDDRYGDFAKNREIKKETGLKRQFLHASTFRFTHPWTHEKMSIEAPLAKDLELALTRLHEKYKS